MVQPRMLFYLLLFSTSSFLYSDDTQRAISTHQPDFFTSMGWHKKSNNKHVRKHFLENNAEAKKALDRLLQFKALYDKNIAISKNPQAKAVIPKIIHQIWVGPKTPPAIFKASQESIKRLHPDWEYRLWTDADIPGLKLYNQKYYDLTPNFGAKADILRYELLARYGGIYLDVDFICIKPLDWLLKYDLWAVTQPLDCRGMICNGAIGSIPKHPIIQEAVHALAHSYDSAPGTKKSVINTVGPLHFERSCMKFLDAKDTNIIVLPAGFFFPIGFTNRKATSNLSSKKAKRKVQSSLLPETLAIHYWAGSWWEN